MSDLIRWLLVLDFIFVICGGFCLWRKSRAEAYAFSFVGIILTTTLLLSTHAPLIISLFSKEQIILSSLEPDIVTLIYTGLIMLMLFSVNIAILFSLIATHKST
jgi:hypothetical protein